MYPTLESELYQSGPYLVIGGVLFSDENQIDIYFILFNEEIICLEKSGYIFIFSEFSDREYVFFIDAFFYKELFSFIFF